jgi:hypothetical protein
MDDDHDREVKEGVARLEAMTEDERTDYAKNLLTETLEAVKMGGDTAMVATAVMACINIRIADAVSQISAALEEMRAAMGGEDDGEGDGAEPRRSYQ